MGNKIFVVLAFLLISSLLIQGCVKEQVQEEMPPKEVEETTEVDEDFSEIDTLEDELSLDEFEDLDKEFEGINW
ncbi:MAG: hypothetical protein ISS23_01500 [Nanoarchaeota archaeon]|nr:hypothetical protein [Nanoarchaeota archaeon]